ncbi:hypothetical protein C8Q80DRAFT_1110492 [Daedaleopsis nitida]|nr:hypothetical protein C8Q80DRAFT_1110492 [Daedaleopsis nitida]
MYLARHWEVNSSVDTIQLLTLCGIYYCTALPIPLDALPVTSTSRVLHLAPCRLQGFTPTQPEYEEYIDRVQDFIKKPHARAGLTLGGIIWCLLLDCLGEEDYITSFFKDASSNRLSGEYSVYGEVAV